MRAALHAAQRADQPSPAAVLPISSPARAPPRRASPLLAAVEGLSKRQLDLECREEAERADKRARTAKAEEGAAATAELRLALHAVRTELRAQRLQLGEQQQQLALAARSVGELEAEVRAQRRQAADASAAQSGDLFDLFLGGGEEGDDGDEDEARPAHLEHAPPSREASRAVAGAAPEQGAEEGADPLCGAFLFGLLDLPAGPGSPADEAANAHGAQDEPLHERARAPAAAEGEGCGGSCSPDRDFCRLAGAPPLEPMDGLEGEAAAGLAAPRLEPAEQLVTPALLKQSQTDHSHSQLDGPPPQWQAERGRRQPPLTRSNSYADQPRSSAHDAAIAAANFGAACRRNLFNTKAGYAESLFDNAMLLAKRSQ